MAQREDLGKERNEGFSCVPLGKTCALSGPQFPHLKRRALPESPSSPSSILICEPERGSPSEHSLDVAEPHLPSSQACGLEDSELGRSWPGQKKEGGGVRRAEKWRGNGHS